MNKLNDYLEAVLDWITAVERFACGDISGELLDSITRDLFDDFEEINMLRSLA